MERTIIDPMEQMRDFDFISFEHDVLVALGGLSADMLSALPNTVAAGLIATQTSTASLTINIAAGRLYQFAPSDAVAVGSIPQDLNVIVQQAFNPGQPLSMVAPSVGQSQWNLVQAQFSQVDAVRTNDPNGGIVPFYNAANPTQPTLNSINTSRKATCVLQVVTGSAATTGSEVPPNPTSGWVPLYMIDLAGNQTQITNSQIITCKPSAGTGVSAGYPFAPFLAGLLASHHSGTPGQAPKIKLASEVQGVLPYINMSPVRTLLSGNLTLYVNGTSGSDSNAGLSPGTPFQTVTAALGAIYHNYDFNGFVPTISVANGTYTAPAIMSGQPVGISSAGIFITGNTLTPASCAYTVTTANAFSASSGAFVTVQGFQISASGPGAGGSAGNAFFASSSGVLSFANCTFGACGSAHLLANASGIVSAIANASYSVVGGAAAHMYADAGGIVAVSPGTANLTGTPAFSLAFAFAGRCGTIQAVGFVSSGSATGLRYTAAGNGTITTGSSASPTFFPGSIAGVSGTGGLYL